jgi:hypothetical protein
MPVLVGPERLLREPYLVWARLLKTSQIVWLSVSYKYSKTYEIEISSYLKRK